MKPESAFSLPDNRAIVVSYNTFKAHIVRGDFATGQRALHVHDTYFLRIGSFASGQRRIDH